ncbi:MAG: class I SAM-dependent methyltransferase [Gammaproteobacteria bacterium]
MSDDDLAPRSAADASALVNRVKKNARHFDRWARRAGVEAYRIYDRDIPEFPYAIDRYGEWLHVQLFDGKRPLSGGDVDAHLHELAAAANCAREQIVLKHRQRQRGSAQYERLAEGGESFEVMEYGLRFEVNLQRYLDTGLFLDHRETRRLVRDQARERSVLNLFAYTGSFSVYAGAGGASRVVSVDLSKTYQDWTWRNLALNGLDDRTRQQLICADVLKFLHEAGSRRERYDLIVLDPPSFSNSKRMQATFDVQRDQVTLLNAALALLAPNGTLYFSTNRHGFKLAPELAERWSFLELDRETLAEDFRRRRGHRCWRVGV